MAKALLPSLRLSLWLCSVKLILEKECVYVVTSGCANEKDLLIAGCSAAAFAN